MKLFSIFLLAATLQADVAFFSGDGIGEHNSLTGANVLIAKHPEWSDPYPGSAWISFAPTGYGDPFWPNTTIEAGPTASFYESFTLLTDGLGVLSIRSDDTAAVYLDNVLLVPPGLFTFRDSTGLVLPFTASAGQHEFRFDAYQLGSDVFGINYFSTITQTTVPEPQYGALLLGLLLLCGLFRFVRMES